VFEARSSVSELISRFVSDSRWANCVPSALRTSIHVENSRPKHERQSQSVNAETRLDVSMRFAVGLSPGRRKRGPCQPVQSVIAKQPEILVERDQSCSGGVLRLWPRRSEVTCLAAEIC
jgi:hypothetical protein